MHNLFNATKISFFNEMRTVARALDLDPGIAFQCTALSAQGMWDSLYGSHDHGPYSGACLPKDVGAWLSFAEDRGLPAPLLSAVRDGQPGMRGKLMRGVFLGAWLVPLIELVMLAVGQIWYRTRFEWTPWKFSRLVIQITTTGREEVRVNQIISEIRSFRLSMPYQIWVVNEPGLTDSYPRADRVLTVPASFTARSKYKARALEYSRRERRRLGLNGPDTKILFVDDDTSVTAAYIERAFGADYDICQGVTTPRVYYGALPFQHFWLSHFDDLRTRGCLIYCAFFQGFVGKPLHVHGEGLCITGATRGQGHLELSSICL